MFTELIPEWVTELLSDIQSPCPSAIIAGGYLRDLDNDHEPKDVDIFINVPGAQSADEAIHALRNQGYIVSVPVEQGSPYEQDRKLEVLLVADLLEYPLPVQLIFTTWPTAEIVDRIDFGICMLSWDGTKINRGQHYDRDKLDRVFRIRRPQITECSLQRSARRYNRLSTTKYLGWSFESYDGHPLHYTGGTLCTSLTQ